ncbi:putative ATP-grasp-modified RiPP [Streptosporangium sp. CA-115845]|uniref:putative ATP-grasp-modified RiPP n=1 Tax=Streptosporangium sp. CA-115845 TaxID=3240071 RepID=UPI003D936C58
MTTAIAPWGLNRTTEPLLECPPLYDTIQFDPVTQLTSFRSRAGVIVDMGNKVTVTTSKGGGSDGSGGSANVADDSNTDS